MRWRLLACLPALCIIVQGCDPVSPRRETVLRIANWGGAGEDSDFDKVLQKIYRDFESQHPGVRIRIENNPDGYVQKMILSFIAKAEPDIMMLDASSAAIFIDNGVLSDLTPLIESDHFRLSDYYQNVVDIARRGKALYAIPQDFTPVVVYYNKRLFERAGVPFPKAGWNFDEFLQTAKKLTVRGPGASTADPPDIAGFSFTNWMAGWVMWLWNNAGDVVSPDGKHASGYLDSPKNVETVAFLRDLVQKYRISPSISQTAAMGVDPFANGQAAMAVSGHWSMIGYANAPKDAAGKPKITWDDLGVVEMPHQTSRPNTVMYESGYAIGKNCKHKELAWEFIKYMTSYRVQKLYQDSGIAVCGRIDVAEQRARNPKVPVEAQFIPIIPSCRPPYGSRIEGYEVVEQMGQNAMDSMLQNGEDVQVALSKAAKRVDREFAKKL